MYLENLRDVGDWLRKLGGGIQRPKQQLNQRESDRRLLKCRDNATYESYKATKREAGKVVQEAKCKAFDNLYNKLGTKEGYNHIYKFSKTREMKKRDLNGVRGIKDEGQRVSVKE